MRLGLRLESRIKKGTQDSEMQPGGPSRGISICGALHPRPYCGMEADSAIEVRITASQQAWPLPPPRLELADDEVHV